MSEIITIAEALRTAAQRLRAALVPNDLLDAQALLAFALGRDRTWLIVNYREPLESARREEFTALIERRSTGEPLQYITGRQEFFGYDFEVTPAVLIPRPESELIVEEVIRLAATERLPAAAPPIIVDVGTGSGCLAVAIAREVEGVRIQAIDLSAAALEVARRNIARNGVADRIEVLAGDLLGPLGDSGEKAWMIVSNPPYIAATEMPELQREVRDWEPRLALTDGHDGLSLYRRLLAAAPRFLLPGGYLICEIGFGQSDSLRAMVGPDDWEEPRFIPDLQGIPRTLVIRRR